MHSKIKLIIFDLFIDDSYQRLKFDSWMRDFFAPERYPFNLYFVVGNLHIDAKGLAGYVSLAYVGTRRHTHNLR